MYIYVVHLKIGDKNEVTKQYREKAVERVDENGVKFIIYEENPIDVDENAEVNMYIFNLTINFTLKCQVKLVIEKTRIVLSDCNSLNLVINS